MFWIILLIVCVILVILWGLSDRYCWDCWEIFMVTGVISLSIAIILAIIVPCYKIKGKAYVETWNQYKEIYETTESNVLNSATISVKIAELNSELIGNKYFYSNYKFFSLLPEEIMELEPIKEPN